MEIMNCKICGYNLKPGQQICPNCGIILDTYKTQQKGFKPNADGSDTRSAKPAADRTQVFRSVQNNSVDPMKYAQRSETPNHMKKPNKKKKKKNSGNAKVAVLSVLLVIMVIVCLVLILKVFNIFPFVEETTTTSTTQTTTAPEYESLFEYDINGSSVTITKYIGTDSSVIIPNEIKGMKVTKIGDMAFNQSIVVQSVTFQSSVIEIGKKAFANCTKLSSVNLTDNLRSIGDQAFYNCPILTYIILPPSISNFGQFVFGNCGNLTIECSRTSEAYRYCKENNYEYRLKVGETETPEEEKSTVPPGIENVSDPAKIYITEPYLNGITIKGATMNQTVYDIPSSIGGFPVLAVSDYAFAKNSTVTKVTIPASVKSIGKYAFSYCPLLNTVEVNSADVNLGTDTFLHGGSQNGMRFIVPADSTAMDYAIVHNIPYSFKQ